MNKLVTKKETVALLQKIIDGIDKYNEDEKGIYHVLIIFKDKDKPNLKEYLTIHDIIDDYLKPSDWYK